MDMMMPSLCAQKLLKKNGIEKGVSRQDVYQLQISYKLKNAKLIKNPRYKLTNISGVIIPTGMVAPLFGKVVMKLKPWGLLALMPQYKMAVS